jgi:hypothetical protein
VIRRCLSFHLKIRIREAVARKRKGFFVFSSPLPN